MRELVEAASDLRQRLDAAGTRVDDLVEISLPNGREMVIACCAVWMAGATPLPVPPRLAPERRLRIEERARPVVAIGARPSRAGTPWIPAEQVAPQPRAAPSAVPSLPDLAASCWKATVSSGSTGEPKIILAAAPAILDPDRPVTSFLPRRAVQLVAGPMTHSASFTYAFRGVMTGHTLVILPRFEEHAWLRAAQQHRATWAMLSPIMMHRLLRLSAVERHAADLSALRTVVHIGAPCAPAMKREFLDWIGPDKVIEVYAGSESNGLAMIGGREWLAHPGSVGRPAPGTEIRIRDADGQDLPVAEQGLVWMRRGERPTYSYLGAASRRDADGWDTLGDIGRLDAEGYLYLTDREVDLIDLDGETVAPATIEHVLEQHPDVRSALALGIAGAPRGHVVAAVVDVAGAGRSQEELLEWGRERLGRRAPTRLLVVDHMLRDDAGKAARRDWATAFSAE